MYLVPREAGSDAEPDMGAGTPLKVGDTLGDGFDLAVAANIEHGSRVEVGVWVDMGTRTYRTRYVLPPSTLFFNLVGGSYVLLGVALLTGTLDFHLRHHHPPSPSPGL